MASGPRAKHRESAPQRARAWLLALALGTAAFAGVGVGGNAGADPNPANCGLHRGQSDYAVAAQDKPKATKTKAKTHEPSDTPRLSKTCHKTPSATPTPSAAPHTKPSKPPTRGVTSLDPTAVPTSVQSPASSFAQPTVRIAPGSGSRADVPTAPTPQVRRTSAPRSAEPSGFELTTPPSSPGPRAIHSSIWATPLSPADHAESSLIALVVVAMTAGVTLFVAIGGRQR